MSEDLITEFLVDGYECLDQLDVDLVELERDPNDAARLASAFRTIHTVKGTSGFLRFTRLQSLVHAGETVLAKMRDREIPFDSEAASAMLALVDAIRTILSHIDVTRREPEDSYAELAARLMRLTERRAVGESGTPPFATGLRIERRSGADRRAVADSSVRVDASTIDALGRLAGELARTRDEIQQLAIERADSKLDAIGRRLDQVTTEMRHALEKTRAQPVGSFLNRFGRIVRDLATACGKQVRLDVEGGETPVPAAIVDAIKDPLTHIIRNAVDHGIEPPQSRVQRGKPIEGCLRLTARHEEGHVILVVSDDGRGMDPSRLRAVGVRRGMIAPDRAAAMSDADALQLIFAPGFSTADRVSTISGRGVGMDVVKTNVERIGGQLSVTSRIGKGTTLTLRIPAGVT